MRAWWRCGISERKSFDEVIAPAIELADGFAIDEMRANVIADSRQFFDLWPTSKAHFMPNGQMPRVGEIFRQPDLARTLRGMAEAEKKALAAGSEPAGGDRRGARLFLSRRNRPQDRRVHARPTAACCATKTWPRSSWRWRSRFRPPITAISVYKPGFWSQGPAMIETLNILEGFDDRIRRSIRPNIFIALTEALKLAYADRDTYYGDPKFNHIPSDVLLSKEYGAERRKLITDKALAGFSSRARSTAKPGIIRPRIEMAHIKIDDALMATTPLASTRSTKMAWCFRRLLRARGCPA